MPLNQSSNGVDQVATQLMDTLTTELPPDTALVAVPLSKASALVIATPEDRSVCSALLGDTKKKIAAIEEDRKRLTRPLDALKKMIMDKYRPALEFFTGEKAIYESKLVLWDREQERLRAAEEARIRWETEARRQAEIRAAQEEEARERAKAEKMRKAAEAAAVESPAEAAVLQEQAATVEWAAVQESAERQEQAAMISTPTVAPAVTRIGGESQSWADSAECVDLRLAVKAVAEGRLPLSCLEFGQVGANKLAKALEEEFRANYPEAATGVRLKKEPVYTHRQKGRK